MNRIFIGLGWLCLVSLAWASPAGAQDNTDMSGETTAPDSFHQAVGDYFKVNQDQINNCQQQKITDEELPVVFFIAQRANVEPAAVLAVHSSGLNWMEAAMHFRLNPWIFFTPMPETVVSHSPFEKAYAYYRDRSDRVNMTDADIVNYVNLKFLSEHYGDDPKEIVQMRASGKSFRDINDHFWKQKEDVKWDVADPNPKAQAPERDGERPGGRRGHRRGGMESNPASDNDGDGD